jgi:hypothetical protein
VKKAVGRVQMGIEALLSVGLANSSMANSDILLGPRVLCTKTAAIAGIAALQTLWGDFQ